MNTCRCERQAALPAPVWATASTRTSANRYQSWRSARARRPTARRTARRTRWWRHPVEIVEVRQGGGVFHVVADARLVLRERADLGIGVGRAALSRYRSCNVIRFRRMSSGLSAGASARSFEFVAIHVPERDLAGDAVRWPPAASTRSKWCSSPVSLTRRASTPPRNEPAAALTGPRAQHVGVPADHALHLLDALVGRLQMAGRSFRRLRTARSPRPGPVRHQGVEDGRDVPGPFGRWSATSANGWPGARRSNWIDVDERLGELVLAAVASSP
jgi:hypothetical protein